MKTSALLFDPATGPSTIDIAKRSIASPKGDTTSENEDNYLSIDAYGCAETLTEEKKCYIQVPGWPHQHRRIAVLDGVGGHGNGRQITERIISQIMAMPAFFTLDSLNQAMEELHQHIRVDFSESEIIPGSTLLFLEIPAEGPAFLFHVGDSRLFAVHQNGLELLTVDHVPATVMAMHGLLNETEWQQKTLFEDNTAISQAFGMGSTFSGPSCMMTHGLYELTPARLPSFLAHLPDRRAITLTRETVFLLATDGLWKYRQPMRILETLPMTLQTCGTNMEEFADAIVDQHCHASLLEKRCDNTSFIVFKMSDSGRNLCV